MRSVSWTLLNSKQSQRGVGGCSELPKFTAAHTSHRAKKSTSALPTGLFFWGEMMAERLREHGLAVARTLRAICAFVRQKARVLKHKHSGDLLTARWANAQPLLYSNDRRSARPVLSPGPIRPSPLIASIKASPAEAKDVPLRLSAGQTLASRRQITTLRSHRKERRLSTRGRGIYASDPVYPAEEGEGCCCYY